MSKLTIGVPLYKNTTGISRTLCLDGEFEILCLDDADNNDFSINGKSNDKRVRVYPGARTGNPIDNWNATLDQMAHREDVGRCVLMHHDEALITDTQQCEIGAMDNNEIGLMQHRNGDKKVLSNRIKCSLLNHFPNLIRVVNFIGPVGLLILPTNIMNRFDNRLKWHVDTEFYYQAAKYYKFVPIKSGLVVSLENPDSITNKLENISLQASKEREILGISTSNITIRLLKIVYHLSRKIIGKYY